MKHPRAIHLLVAISTAIALHASTLDAQGPGRAPEEMPANLARLAASSEIILAGIPVSMEARWNRRKTLIFTYVTYRVSEAIKGVSENQAIVVRFHGGEVGGVGQIAIGAPRARLGEEDLLFLASCEEPTVYQVYGVNLGKLDVRRDASSGRAYVATANRAREGLGRPFPREPAKTNGARAAGPGSGNARGWIPLSRIVSELMQKGPGS